MVRPNFKALAKQAGKSAVQGTKKAAIQGGKELGRQTVRGADRVARNESEEYDAVSNVYDKGKKGVNTIKKTVNGAKKTINAIRNAPKNIKTAIRAAKMAGAAAKKGIVWLLTTPWGWVAILAIILFGGAIGSAINSSDNYEDSVTDEYGYGEVGPDGLTLQQKAILVECGVTDSKIGDKLGTGSGDNGGLTEAAKLEVAQKVYSVMSEFGLNEIQIAGILGNWDVESGLNPKKMESDYMSYMRENQYEIADEKGPTVENVATIGVAQWMANSGGNTTGYQVPEGSGQPPHWIGTGLGQWTGIGSKSLYEFAKENKTTMFKIETQLAYMLSDLPNGVSYYPRLQKYKSMSPATAGDAAMNFFDYWEYAGGGPRSETTKVDKRQEAATKWLVNIKKMTVDEKFAKSILSMAKTTSAASNKSSASSQKSAQQCGTSTKKFGGNGWQEAGGSHNYKGPWNAWKPKDLPDDLKQYALDPESLGIEYGKKDNWLNPSSIWNQCTDLSATLMHNLWEKNGEHPTNLKGNGIEVVGNWVATFGGSSSKDPVSGAVFSSKTKYVEGHTGVVSHVFEDGSILMIEQNASGYSGEGNGTICTWNYRIVQVSELEAEDYVFYNPGDNGFTVNPNAKSMG